MSPDGVLLPGGLFASIIAAGGTWALALVLGHAILPAAREQGADDAVGRLLTAAVAGTTLQSLIVLALSQFGVLRPLPLVCTTLACAALAAGFRGRRLIAELRLTFTAQGPPRDARLVMLLAAIPVAAAFVLASVPTVYYDDLVYHLGLPRQALITGAWPAMPGFHYSFLPSGWDSVHAFPLAVGGGLGPQFRNAIALALLAVAGWRLARLGASRVAAGAAVALLVSAPMMVSLGSHASNDIFVALAAAVALERAARGHAVEAALAGGAAWGAKYTGLPVLGATALLLALARTKEPVLTRWVRATGALGLGLLLPAAWTLRTFLLTGSPIFPGFWSHLGGRHWDALSAAALSGDVGAGTLGERGPVALVFTPFDWLLRSESLSYPGGLQPLFLIAGAGGLLLARRFPEGPRLVAAGGVLYLGSCLTSLYPRFALPLFVCLLPFAAAAVQTLVVRLEGQRRFVPLTAALLLSSACLWGTGRGVLLHVSAYGGGLEVLVQDRDEILPERIFLARAERDLAEHLPEDARVLVVGEGRLALLPRRATASSGYDPSWPSLVVQEGDDGPSVARAFEGFTHVLVNFKELERFDGTYAYREHFAGQSDEAFLTWLGSLEPVARWGSVVLSEVPALPDD